MCTLVGLQCHPILLPQSFPVEAHELGNWPLQPRSTGRSESNVPFQSFEELWADATGVETDQSGAGTGEDIIYDWTQAPGSSGLKQKIHAAVVFDDIFVISADSRLQVNIPNSADFILGPLDDMIRNHKEFVVRCIGAVGACLKVGSIAASAAAEARLELDSSLSDLEWLAEARESENTATGIDYAINAALIVAESILALEVEEKPLLMQAIKHLRGPSRFATRYFAFIGLVCCYNLTQWLSSSPHCLLSRVFIKPLSLLGMSRLSRLQECKR